MQRPCGVNAGQVVATPALQPHFACLVCAAGIAVALSEAVVAVTPYHSARRITVAAFGTLAHADRATDRIKERDRMNFIARLRALLRDTSGQDLLEYALLVALIALVCVAVITSTGTNVQSIFSKISGALSTAAAS